MHRGQDDCTPATRIRFVRCRVAAIPLILLALGPIACASSDTATYRTAPSPSATASSVPSATLADLTNAARIRAGFGPLTVEPQLNIAAQLQAAQLAALQVLQHNIPDGSNPAPSDRLAAAGYAWRAYGENIASGYPSAAETVAAWMNPPGQTTSSTRPSPRSGPPRPAT